jgi:hypothetical protein
MFNYFDYFNKGLIFGKSGNKYSPTTQYTWIVYNDNKTIVYNDNKTIVYEE